MSLLPFTLRPAIRKRLYLIGALALAFWLLFLDSHSVLRRVQYYRELRYLTKENEQMQENIAELNESIAQGLSDETVEKIAREQYGMRRPGETVYRIEVGD
ncbi:MAG: septum formation initiator family protein [Rubricoccaceae bacterium]|nr:septum formation initiator family protein [Rubricoccaceae bacterium]